MEKESLVVSHILLQKLLEDIKPALNRILKAAKTDDDVKNFFNRDLNVEYTEKEHYNIKVFLCCSNINNTIERIRAISVYVSTFPTPKKYSKNGIMKKDWIAYHYANFEVAKVSLYDSTLLLVNQVFVLGLRPQNCNKETVRENEWIKNSKDISDSIDAIEKVTRESRYPKNLFIHRGILPNLDNIDFLDIFDRTSSYSDLGISTTELEDLFKMAFQEISEEIKEGLEKLEANIVKLFDAILLEYNKQI